VKPAPASVAPVAAADRVPILMFVPHYPYPVVGGLERQAHELAKALRRFGEEVTVLAARFGPSQLVHETVEGVPVWRVYRSPPSRLGLVWAGFQLALGLWRLRTRHRVLHVHQYSWVGLFCIWWGAQLGYRVVAKLANVGDYGVPGLARGRLGPVRLHMLKSAHCIVAMSAESCLELESVGFARTRTLRVTNGIVTSEPSSGADADRGSASARLRVVFVGRLSEEKCVHHLLEAWAVVTHSKAIDASLELWGEGPLRAELQALADRLGISERVAFRGHVPEVRSKLREVDIFVLASRVEGNSNAILEAMDAGLPIVATRVGGTPMQVGAAGSAWLVEPGDVIALADRLARLLADDSQREMLGRAMRRRIEEHFSLEHVARIYRQAYSKLGSQDGPDLTSVGGLPR
jgi:glycogen(starch) synthase